MVSEGKAGAFGGRKLKSGARYLFRHLSIVRLSRGRNIADKKKGQEEGAEKVFTKGVERNSKVRKENENKDLGKMREKEENLVALRFFVLF